MRHFKFFLNKNYKKTLKENFFFKDYSYEEFDEFLYKYEWYTEPFKKGEISFDQIRFIKDMNIVLEGEYKIEKTIANGENILYDFIKTNGLFGIAFLNANLTLDDLHLEACKESSLFVIKEEEYKRILREDTKFYNKHLQFQEYRLAFFIRRFENSFLNNPYDKLVYFIEYLTKFDMYKIDIPKTQLANYLNIGRASLYRELKKLELEGRIEVRAGDIYIVN